MTELDHVTTHLGEMADLARRVADEQAEELEAAARQVMAVLRNGGTLLLCGNGGSAAEAQHLAAEYVVRFRRERRPLPALALTTDTSILTAGGNDFGFDTIFARQVAALGREGDLLILYSTSGESENLLLAADEARNRGIGTLAFLARGGGRLRSRVDRSVVIPTDQTALAQELHLAAGHVICELVDRAFAREDTP